MTEKFIWAFGNAVQDITLDLIDLDRLMIEYENIPKKIRLDGDLKLADNLWIKTRAGLDHFTAEMKFKDVNKKDGFYSLPPGGKFTLLGSVHDSYKEIPSSAETLFVSCENILWGGGGLNCVTFLRSLVPDSIIMPILYTDIAMSRTLHVFVKKIHKLMGEALKKVSNEEVPLGEVSKNISTLMDQQPAEAEELTYHLASTMSEYSPRRSIEVYLASLPVDFLFYRPMKPCSRRNIIFTRARSATRSMNDKIICKGSSNRLDEVEEKDILKLLKVRKSGVGAIVLNSISDEQMFHASYDLYTAANKADKDVVGIFAMTKTMQGFLSWMRKKKGNRSFPPFILIFNEKEAYEFAKEFNSDVQQFIEYSGDMPNISRFVEIAKTIRQQFEVDAVPRIYVTIGDRGSIGVERDGRVIYVWRFSKPGAVIFDTNACGDAYCSAITMLEWAKRHLDPLVAGVDLAETSGVVNEMRYFMAVASAAAYAKATNRRGRVDGTEVIDLLEHGHLASVILPDVNQIKEVESRSKLPEWIGQDNRLKIPVAARRLGVTKTLRKLLANAG